MTPAPAIARPVQALAALALIVTAAGTAGVHAQMYVPTGRDTLRGLPGVEVVVDELPPELAQHRLTASLLRDDVTAALRAAGITVYASQDENPSPARPYLYLLVGALELPDGAGHALAIQLHLRQMLRSPVTDSNIVNAMTWESSGLLVTPRDGLSALRDEVRSYVDQFIGDWQLVRR